MLRDCGGWGWKKEDETVQLRFFVLCGCCCEPPGLGGSDFMLFML